MLYSEFLELTKISSELVDPVYYHGSIETIYMDCDEKITKEIFCEQWRHYARYELPEVADTREFLGHLDALVLKATRKATDELRKMLLD
jgi:hypothetical protein